MLRASDKFSRNGDQLEISANKMGKRSNGSVVLKLETYPRYPLL